MHCQLLAYAFLAALVVLPIRTPAAVFTPGDILLDEFIGADIQQYGQDGSLRRTFANGRPNAEGVAVTPGPTGLLATAYRYGPFGGSTGVDLFQADGTIAATFATPDVYYPGDLSVFPDGVLAISDQGNHSVSLYTQGGTHVRTITAAGIASPFGSAVAGDGTLWVADGGGDALFHFAESGTLLGRTALTFNPGDVAVSPVDGTLYVSVGGGNVVYHLSATAAQLATFTTALSGLSSDEFAGLGVAPDGSLYVTSEKAFSIYHYGPTGIPLGSISIGTSAETPLFLTVVPTAVPEPTAALIVSAVALLGCRRTRRQFRYSAGVGETGST